MDFKLVSNYVPTGDQPEAIAQLVEGIQKGDRAQVLLGVTGSGKTFTMANVIEKLNRPTLILTHNKTLTAQLYGEFKQFFPNNAVEYLQINEEVDKLRLRATSSVLSGRRDIIVVASVSCIYGMGNPEDYKTGIIRIQKGQIISRNTFLYSLVQSLYSRTEGELGRAMFRVRGDTVDINLPYVDYGYRIVFFGDEIESIDMIDVISGQRGESMDAVAIFPANLYVAPKDRIHEIVREIQDELHEQIQYYKREGKPLEAKRIEERTNFDLEMIKELGYCSGIENYSRFFDRRNMGDRPFCLLDYFPEDYLMFVDESHATMPQIRGMWGGDRARKQSLVGYGFRLPSCIDNRPLQSAMA